MTLLKLKTRKNSKTGLPATLGLFNQRIEIEAEWYERKPFALEIEWDIRTKEPFAGGQWLINCVIAFDEQGKVSEVYRFKTDVLLAGPIERKTPLEPRHIEFRKSRGIPLEDDPYQGDTLHVSIEVMP